MNRKRVQRILQLAGLHLPKRRMRQRTRQKQAPCPDHCRCIEHVWTVDFLFDHTMNGKSMKVLSVIDEFTREYLALPCGRSFNAKDPLCQYQ
jgi:putative transposase